MNLKIRTWKEAAIFLAFHDGLIAFGDGSRLDLEDGLEDNGLAWIGDNEKIESGAEVWAGIRPVDETATTCRELRSLLVRAGNEILADRGFYSREREQQDYRLSVLEARDEAARNRA